MLSLKEFFVKHENRIILFIGVILLSVISYGVGRLSMPQPKEPVVIEANSQEIIPVGSIMNDDGQSQLVERAKKEEKLEANKVVDSTPVTTDNAETQQAKKEKKSVQKGIYVASKNGTKYHLPSCSGAKRIKEENKIWFNSKQEAVQAGYEPAKNCKGI